MSVVEDADGVYTLTSPKLNAFGEGYPQIFFDDIEFYKAKVSLFLEPSLGVPSLVDS